MRYKALIGLMLAVLVPSVCLADATYRVAVHEGINEIPFSIANGWNNDLSNVRVSVDESSLPAWLSVEGFDCAIPALRTSEKTRCFTLRLDVDGAEADEAFTVPLALEDGFGNVWSVQLEVAASGDGVYGPKRIDALYRNFPNPFNPSTTIEYAVSNKAHTTIVIYNSLGQKVKTLIDSVMQPGRHTVRWNGDTESGQSVSAGVYFCRMTAGSFVKTHKMVLVE